MPTLAVNKRANFEYQILDKYTAGLSLSGGLVKEIRANRVNLQGVYIIFQNNQLQLINFGNEKAQENVVLLLNQNEITKITKAIQIQGITCIPVKVFTSKRWLKMEIAVVKGKKLWDKRQTIKERDLDREERRSGRL
jgi:SsrA-binding protein